MFDKLVTEDLRNLSEEELDKDFFVHKDGIRLFLGRIPLGCVYSTFLAGLYIEMEKIVGRAAKGLILGASRNRGKIAGKSIRRRYEKNFRNMDEDTAKMIVGNMLTIWSKCFGWGKISFEGIDDELVVVVEDSFEAVGHLKLGKKSDKPVCWMLLGYVWGLVEGLFNCKFEGKEVSCKAMGDENCKFIFKKFS